MTSFLNLEEELKAGEEHPLNEAKGAVGGPQTGALEDALQSSGTQKVDQKLFALMKRAWTAAKAGDKTKAARLALKALDYNPENGLANQLMAVILEEMGRLSKSLEFYQRAVRYSPNNPDLYHNLGHIAWRLDMLDGAEKFFRIYLEMRPDVPAASINLASIIREKGNTPDAIELLRAAIYRMPDSHELWNTMGSTLLESGEPEQALTFYAETIRLCPEYSRGYHNKAYALDLLGRLDEAVENFKKALDLNTSEKDHASIEHGMSLAMLSNGQLTEGWKHQHSRLNPHYRGYVKFQTKCPMWDGENPDEVKGKRILVVGEQGLGDEIMQASALLDLFDAVGPDGAVALVCENRLIPIFKRSFPQLEQVTRHFTKTIETIKIRSLLNAEDDFKPDLWTPMANLQLAFRTCHDDFPSEASLTPDLDRVKDLKARLSELPEGQKIGFTWKSKLMTHSRIKYFSPLDAWKPVLQTPGVTFVNLQYGDVDEDIAYCEKKFGVKIHQIDDLDLHDDLDGVAALGSALDLSIGQSNSSIALSACCGGRTWVLNSGRRTWTQFGADQILWLPGSTCYNPQKFRDWPEAIRRIAVDLEKLAKPRRKGAA